MVIASTQLSEDERNDAGQHIAGQLLLNVSSNAQAWTEWFSQHDLPHRSMRIGPSFEMTAHLIQAVRANIGVGLVPRILVEDELLNGELLQLGEPITSRRSYYLVYPPRNEALPSLKAFRDWLVETL